MKGTTTKPKRHRRSLATLLALMALLVPTICQAGIRAPGPYAGVIIFDRWGGCEVFSGEYLMYISQTISGYFRKYAGQCIELNATKVFQPDNPGDGIIQAYDTISTPPDDPWYSPINGVTLAASVEAAQDYINVDVRNTSNVAIKLDTSMLAPAVLKPTATPREQSYAGSGVSFALITRIPMSSPEQPTAQSVWGLPVVTPARFGRFMNMAPGQTVRFSMHCELPPGEYEFLCGYGGGVLEYKSICSNPLNFDVPQTGQIAAR